MKTKQHPRCCAACLLEDIPRLKDR
jgi:hypothetical protein